MRTKCRPATVKASQIMLALLMVGMFSVSPARAVTLRAGDIGFSAQTGKGAMWVYGDSWVDGRLVRNAFTLNGVYTGQIRGVRSGHWVWPGQPFPLANGHYALYGTEMEQTAPGMWGFHTLGGIRAEFDPANVGAAQVKTFRSSTGIYWTAASTGTASRPYLYAANGSHHALVGQPRSDGTVAQIRDMGGSISNQFSVIQDSIGSWWMVGQLPFLSRRVVAYPLAGRAGPVAGPYLPLATLPSPGANRFTYAATIHPDYNGLLTWAVNGSGPGTPYGLQRIPGFWPKALQAAQAIQGGPSARIASALLAARAGVTQPDGRQAMISLGQQIKDEIDDQIETSDQANRLEKLLNQDEGWLQSPPDPLQAGQNAQPGSPATREFAGRGQRPPEGEDQLSDRQGGLKLARGRGKVKRGDSKKKTESQNSDLGDFLEHMPRNWPNGWSKKWSAGWLMPDKKMV